MALLLKLDEPRDKITAYRCYLLQHLGMFVLQKCISHLEHANICLDAIAWALEKPHKLYGVGSTSTAKQKARTGMGIYPSLILSILLGYSALPKHTLLGLLQLVCLDDIQVASSLWTENTFL